ncbi:MAG: CDP-alcohol phosphatidyltransferase family protein [Anaerolineales bacterium]
MSPKSHARASAFRALRLRWAFALIAGLLALFAFRGLLAGQWPTSQSNPWFVLAALVFVFQFSILWFDLPQNSLKSKNRLLPRLGPGTWLSLLRLLALSMLGGFLWPARPSGWLAWAPFALLLLFSLLDLADGYAARVSGKATRLGEKLDLDLDARGMLVAALLAFHYAAAGWWYLLVGLARYIYLIAVWARKQMGLRFASPPNCLRRPFAGTQLGIGSALLAPGLPAELTVFISSVSMVPFLANFLYDWWVGAEWLRFRKKNRKRFIKIWQHIRDWSLLIIRLFLVLLILLRIASASSSDLYVAFDATLGLALFFGAMGRPAAFAFLVGTGLRLLGQNPDGIDFALLFIGLILLYLGPGAFSLRKSNELWIFRRAGEKTSP